MAENTAIRILVVDDHPVLRDGVAAILETQSDMTLVGEARDGAEAIVRFRELKPDVTLMDLQMPGVRGVEAITAIRAEFPNARILVLTTYDGDVQAVRALKAGALGFLLKSSLRTEMLEAIRDVHRGRGHIHRDVASEIASHIANDPLMGCRTRPRRSRSGLAWCCTCSRRSWSSTIPTVTPTLWLAQSRTRLFRRAAWPGGAQAPASRVAVPPTRAAVRPHCARKA